MRVCVIGNFSGRNTGDAAILGGLLKDVTSSFGPVTFEVPTINPGFVQRQYAGFDVHPVGMLPWNLSAKIFGLPILRSILRSNLVLVTDAILFDRKLFNPLFNYLSTMALVLPLAKSRSIPVVLYNVSLGPARTRMGRVCLRRVLDASSEIILRDKESLGEIPPGGGYTARIRNGADCALSVEPARGEVVDRIVATEGLRDGGRSFLTFNVNSYIDVFVRDRGSRVRIEDFAALMGDAVNQVMARIDSNVVFVITQPMDTKITNMVTSRVKDKARLRLVGNPKYSYQELAGILGRAEMHVGMRTHSLILASSMRTPVVGIIATPKNRGYMRSIRQDERMMEFADLSSASLADLVCRTWNNRKSISAELEPVIAAEKQKARSAAEFLRPYMEARGLRQAPRAA